MTADDLLARLEGVRQQGRGRRWLARCPAHADKTPSLSLRELDDARLLVHCFAGCDVEAVVAAVGLTLADLMPPRPIEQTKGERRPFPAADVLRALADEAQLVAVAAANIGAGVPLSDQDRARLLLAAERINAGRSLALGYR